MEEVLTEYSQFTHKIYNTTFYLSRQYEDKTNLLLFDLYEAWNKPEKAQEWRTKLSERQAKLL
jgi:hypothetical protein